MDLKYEHLLPLYLCELCLVVLIDTLVHFYVAISKNMTINELNQPWNYKYNFVAKNVPSKTEKKTAY